MHNIEDITAVIAEMNDQAPEGQEWCEWSGRYVTLGMAVGIN